VTVGQPAPSIINKREWNVMKGAQKTENNHGKPNEDEATKRPRKIGKAPLHACYLLSLIETIYLELKAPEFLSTSHSLIRNELQSTQFRSAISQLGTLSHQRRCAAAKAR
jgi:hypothetical protein